MTIHVNDYGVVTLQAALKKEDGTPLNVAEALTIELIMERRKNIDVLVVTPVLVNDGTDGLVKYTFQDGDLSVKGRWRIQSRVEFSNGVIHADISTIQVDENIPIPVVAP